MREIQYFDLEEVDKDGNVVTYKMQVQQMSATNLEKFIFKGVAMLAKGGASAKDIKFDDINIDTMMALVSELEYEKVQPLLDMLLACCERVDVNPHMKCERRMLDGLFHNVINIYKIYVEAFKVNFTKLIQGESLSFQGNSHIKMKQVK